MGQRRLSRIQGLFQNASTRCTNRRPLVLFRSASRTQRCSRFCRDGSRIHEPSRFGTPHPPGHRTLWTGIPLIALCGRSMGRNTSTAGAQSLLRIRVRGAIDASPEGVSTKTCSQKRNMIRKGRGTAFPSLLKLSCSTLRGIRHDARCGSSPSSESRVFRCFAWMRVSDDDRSQVCAAIAVAPFYLLWCNLFNFCFE